MPFQRNAFMHFIQHSIFDIDTYNRRFKDQNMSNNPCSWTRKMETLLGMNKSAFCIPGVSKSIVCGCADEGTVSGGLPHPHDICTMVKGSSKWSVNNLMCIPMNLFSPIKRWKDLSVLHLVSRAWELVLFPIHSLFYFEKPKIVHWDEAKPNKSFQNIFGCSGILPNDKRYFSYRFHLYCNKFSPSSQKFPQNSEGCYMIRLGLPLVRRKSMSSGRTIWLTSRGVSTNIVLENLIPDMMRGSYEGCHLF